MSQEVTDDDLIGWMGDKCYAEICDMLSREIYQMQAKAFEHGTHEELLEARGYCKGLAFFINLRELLVAQQKYAEGGFDEETV